MKALIQCVTRASVEVEGHIRGQIGEGLLVFVGVAKGDTDRDGRLLAEKFSTFRLFTDAQGKMNRSLVDVGGGVLLVSQVTLLGRTANGRRPSFDEAAPPDEARRLYEGVAADLRKHNVQVETGVFGAHMRVTLTNDGPVTFMLDSRDAPR